MKKMGAAAAVVAMILMVSIIVVPSYAESEDCWDRITNCIDKSSDMDICCSVFREVVDDERECFCSYKPVIDRDNDLERSVNSVLAGCERGTFDNLCSSKSNGNKLQVILAAVVVPLVSVIVAFVI